MTRTDTTHDWHGDQLDLDAYLHRIGYEGERGATLEALRALHRAHVTAIPFENLDVMLGVPVALDLASVQDKLVRRRRGGYCFEHVVLFAAALERLGFTFTGLVGRVTLGYDKVIPPTHALLAVRTSDDARLWLSDVGFGGGPLEPLELADGAEAEQEGWRFRVERSPGALGVDSWQLCQYGPDGWVGRHAFSLVPAHRVDYEVGNHYVSTHPRSPFVRRPFLQRFEPARAHRLDAGVRSTVGPDGSRTEWKVGPGDFARVAEEDFGITLSPAEAARLTALLDAS